MSWVCEHISHEDKMRSCHVLQHTTWEVVFTGICCWCSVAKLCPILCNPMDCRSMSGSSVLHYLPEFAQTHVHWVSDAIQPSRPLSSPSPPAFNLSQHQGLSNESALHIRWPKYGASASASVLPMNTQDWFPLGLTGLLSLIQGFSRLFPSTTVQKHHWHMGESFNVVIF